MTDPTAQQSPAGWQRWALIALVAVAIAGLAFAIGRFSTFGSAGASAVPTNSSADAGFARDMQVHHAQAIAMAMEIYRKTEDEELRVLSYDIATGQAGQRGEMFDWLVQWGLPQSGGPMMDWMSASEAGHEHGAAEPGATLTDEQARVAMGMASDAELRALADATGQQADCLFLELMIRHHEGAIPMAEAVIELGTEPRVLSVAESIRAGQTAEIDAMESMAQRLACG